MDRRLVLKIFGPIYLNLFDSVQVMGSFKGIFVRPRSPQIDSKKMLRRLAGGASSKKLEVSEAIIMGVSAAVGAAIAAYVGFVLIGGWFRCRASPSTSFHGVFRD